MADQEQIAQMGHLMRRAGFGASYEELEAKAAGGYEATVEDLLHPERFEPIDNDLLYRFMPGYEGALGPPLNQGEWVYRMINTRRPLEEKMALFWHQLFATGNSKVDNPPELTQQIEMFRRNGLGSFRELLVDLAKNPAMIFWLDNNGNHMGAINENWGRELLELFSMGVGNYSEDDIKEASRAFTGWTIGPKIPRNPLGRFYWNFEYRPEDHDDGEKTFLGNTGNLNGQDIIDIVVNQPATARFLSRHLYNFFVADEPQVPSWNITPPNDPDAVDQLVAAYDESGGDVRVMLRVLFNSDFFKQARYSRVKSPAELVIGGRPLGRQLRGPTPRLQPVGLRVRLSRAGATESPKRGKLAHRRRVDRRGRVGAAGQLRRQPAGRHLSAGSPSHREQSPGTRQADTGRTDRKLLGNGRPDGNRRGDPSRVAGTRPRRRGRPVGYRGGCRRVGKASRSNAGPDRRITGLPVRLKIPDRRPKGTRTFSSPGRRGSRLCRDPDASGLG